MLICVHPWLLARGAKREGGHSCLLVSLRGLPGLVRVFRAFRGRPCGASRKSLRRYDQRHRPGSPDPSYRCTAFIRVDPCASVVAPRGAKREGGHSCPLVSIRGCPALSVFSVCSVGDLAGDGARGQAETCNGPEGNGTSDKEGATGDAARGRPSARGQIQQSIADESPSRVAGFGLTPSDRTPSAGLSRDMGHWILGGCRFRPTPSTRLLPQRFPESYRGGEKRSAAVRGNSV